MSKTKTLKGGIPIFDTAGHVSMIPGTRYQESLGFTVRKIAFTEPPGGGQTYILLADIGTDPLPTGFPMKGFCGLAFKTNNNGYIFNGFGMAVVNVMASYSSTADSLLCESTNSKLVPMILKYKGHVYAAIRVSGNTGSLHLYGKEYGLLDTPVILNNRDGMMKADATILKSSESGGVKCCLIVCYTNVIQEGGWLRDGHSEDTHRRNPQAAAAAHDDTPGRSHRHRHLHLPRNIHHERPHHISHTRAIPVMELRMARGDDPRRQCATARHISARRTVSLPDPVKRRLVALVSAPAQDRRTIASGKEVANG